MMSSDNGCNLCMKKRQRAPVEPPGTSTTTAPKPFVFVLMPFDQTFADIYTFGIKVAVQEVGAYCERIDEQMFTEGILDRVFNPPMSISRLRRAGCSCRRRSTTRRRRSSR